MTFDGSVDDDLGLFKMFFYFPNGQSTIWGIYSDFFIFLGPLKQIKDDDDDDDDHGKNDENDGFMQ